MNKVYNKIDDVVNGFYDFFKNFSNSKTLLNFMPQFLCSIIDAESVTYSKIALSFSLSLEVALSPLVSTVT